MSHEVFKKCACGQRYTKEAWDFLPPLTKPGNSNGLVEFPWGEVHQMKRCISCGSTLNVVIIEQPS